NDLSLLIITIHRLFTRGWMLVCIKFRIIIIGFQGFTGTSWEGEKRKAQSVMAQGTGRKAKGKKVKS
ncbi:MAG: hypothetical protein RBT01_15350, partial [Anaerolineaceae bacterium]|nr:hypothetical protein [Anaerolineaceae bacterium]